MIRPKLSQRRSYRPGRSCRLQCPLDQHRLAPAQRPGSRAFGRIGQKAYSRPAVNKRRLGKLAIRVKIARRAALQAGLAHAPLHVVDGTVAATSTYEEHPVDLDRRTNDKNGKNGASDANGNGAHSKTDGKADGKKGRARAAAGAPGASRAELKELLGAMNAAARGDFTSRLQVERYSGLMESLAGAFNRVASMNASMVSEMVRVERVVGREGRMTERASLGDVSGGWATSLEAINSLIGDLVQPTTEVARVITAVAKGDLSQKMALEIEGRPVKGEFLRIGTTVNSMVDQLNSFAAEVTRVAKEVGTEGKLGGQAEVKGVSGTWKDLTDNVNGLAGNLTAQVRNIAKVTTAVANGDLSQKITVDAKGEMLELKNTINTMVDQLNSFAAEVTRVAKEVGTEGKLGGQADVKGVSGTWKDLTDNVNVLAPQPDQPGAKHRQGHHRRRQRRPVAEDHGRRQRRDPRAEEHHQHDGRSAAARSPRKSPASPAKSAPKASSAARPRCKGVSGTWKDLTDNVNVMAGNLTTQVRNIAKVTTAVANGDLSQKITVDAKGEILRAQRHHQHDGRLSSARSPSEVTRVAPTKSAPKASSAARPTCKACRGTWKDLTDNVNVLAGNLTDSGAQHRQGHHRRRQRRPVPEDHGRCQGRNPRAEKHHQHDGRPAQLVRRRSDPRRERSRHRRQARRPGRRQRRVGHLERPHRQRQLHGRQPDHPGAQHRQGRRPRSPTATCRRRSRSTPKAKSSRSKNTINTMVDQLGILRRRSDPRRARGRHRRQAGRPGRVPGVSGTWKDLTDNVNVLAANLTDQVRNIAKVTTAVANGDLSQKITVDVKGEILELKNTINIMVDQLSSFAAEVTRVARKSAPKGSSAARPRSRASPAPGKT